MRDFLHRGLRIVLHAVAGQVLSSDRSSSTEYTLKGGGGYVPSQGGYVAPPQLNSTTTESQELWLKLENGLQRRFELTGGTVPVLIGQQVVMVLGTTNGAVSDVPVGLLNISSQMWHPLPRSLGLLWFIDSPSKTTSVVLMWTAITLIFFAGCLVWGFSERGSPWVEVGGWTTLGTPCFGFCFWIYTRVTFAARVDTAHERLQEQALEDSRHYLAAPRPV